MLNNITLYSRQDCQLRCFTSNNDCFYLLAQVTSWPDHAFPSFPVLVPKLKQRARFIVSLLHWNLGQQYAKYPEEPIGEKKQDTYHFQ